MIDGNNRNSLTAHIDRDLYGNPDQKALEAQKAAKREFNEMVHAALNGSKDRGADLLAYLEGYLKAPIWMPSEPTELMPYREGARSLVRHLLDAYNAGGSVPPKKTK
ncbi:hypothetical protein NVP1257O_06 [Vibrio phage 1.257.O._10N.286.46.A4]|nr:hypothetical protein NVP1257O_06 [Vibrio phage 1.257.O._10N.286.46.A4]